jgi:hypothetical protein
MIAARGPIADQRESAILANLRREFEVCAKEGGAQFGNELLTDIAFVIPVTVPASIRTCAIP